MRPKEDHKSNHHISTGIDGGILSTRYSGIGENVVLESIKKLTNLRLEKISTFACISTGA